MSGTLFYYAKMALVASTDLLLGFGVAYVTNKWFLENSRIKASESEWERAKAEILWTCFQGVSTIFLGDEIRNLVYPKDFQDPTGGVIFMLSLSQQPLLWERLFSLFNFLDSKYTQFLRGSVRMDDNPPNRIPMEELADFERPVESERTELNRLGPVSHRDAQLRPGIPQTSLNARSSSSKFDL